MNIWGMWYFRYVLWNIMIVFKKLLLKFWILCVFIFFWRDWNLERYVFCIFFGFMNIWDMWYFIYDLWSIMIVFEISLIKIWLFCVFVFFLKRLKLGKIRFLYIFWFHEYLRYLIFQICFWSIMMVFSISILIF